MDMEVQLPDDKIEPRIEQAPKRAYTRREKPRTKIAGSELVPDLRCPETTEREYWYWIGVTPNCPREWLDCAGLNFPKINEDLIVSTDRMGGKERVKRIGALVRLSRQKIDLLRERLPRMVMRMLTIEGEKEEPGTGKNMGDLHQQPQKGYPIRIPTAEEIAEKRAAGKATHAYVPHPNDVPAARFMFCILCTDQERGNRGESYPETLETAGLEWPGE